MHGQIQHDLLGIADTFQRVYREGEGGPGGPGEV